MPRVDLTDEEYAWLAARRAGRILPPGGEDFAALVDVMAGLRGSNGCPWDREQTHATLKRFLLEEAYEVLDAIDEGIPSKLCEELGDLLLQVVFHAQLAAETGQFTVHDVCRVIVQKLVRRHPHVFGTVSVSGTDDVLTNWEAIKRAEPGYEDRQSILDGVPNSLPALLRALEVSKRVVKVGFEWPDLAGVLDKVDEEWGELRAELAQADVEPERAAAELGDLLFTLVNVARHLKIDPEDALRRMTLRFTSRFRRIEDHAAQRGVSVHALSLDEMETVWQAAKREQ